MLINNIFNGLAYPFAGPLGNGLRAAGDVKFTMLVSISLTIAARSRSHMQIREIVVQIKKIVVQIKKIVVQRTTISQFCTT